MIEETKQIFITEAKRLGDYESISKTDLANGYCDADEKGDESKRSQYYAALMLRYWYKIYEWNKNSKSLNLELDDFVGWLEDAFEIAFRYREWRKRKSKLYKDPNGPDKVINRCCFSVRGLHYQYCNKDKRRANYVTNSIDSQIEEYGDSADILKDAAVYNKEFSGVDNVIMNLVQRKKYIEALAISGIVEGDVFKEMKRNIKQKIVNDLGEEVVEKRADQYLKFDENRLVKYLTHLTRKEMNEFAKKFYIDDYEKNRIYRKLMGLNGTKLHVCIRRLFKELKGSKKTAALINN